VERHGEDRALDHLEEDRAVGVEHLEEGQEAGEEQPQPFPEVEAYLQLALVEEPRMYSPAAVRRMHLVEGHRMRLAGGLAEEEEVLVNVEGGLPEVLVSTTDQGVDYRLVTAALGSGQQVGDPLDPSVGPSATVVRHNYFDWAPAALVLHAEVPGVHPEDQAHRVRAELLHLDLRNSVQNA
jgi:hypothetical protein